MTDRERWLLALEIATEHYYWARKQKHGASAYLCAMGLDRLVEINRHSSAKIKIADIAMVWLNLPLSCPPPPDPFADTYSPGRSPRNYTHESYKRALSKGASTKRTPMPKQITYRERRSMTARIISMQRAKRAFCIAGMML